MTTTKTKPTTAGPRDRIKDGMPSMIAYLTRVLKTPTIGAFWEELAGQARDENWSHEEYLAALLQRQVADRESKGTVMRIRTAHFPTVKTLEDFNLDHLPSLRRDVLAHLATSTYVAKAENVILLGPGVIRGLILKVWRLVWSCRCCDCRDERFSACWWGAARAHGGRVRGGGRGSRCGLVPVRRGVLGLLGGAVS